MKCIVGYVVEKGLHAPEIRGLNIYIICIVECIGEKVLHAPELGGLICLYNLLWNALRKRGLTPRK
jgi:hypothetical protein